MSMVRRLLSERASLMLALVALALLARAAIPVGWMPNVQGDRIAISICSGEGRQTMWLDKAGKLHQGDSNGEEHQDHPCAFAGVTPALDAPASPAPLVIAASASFPFASHTLSIGQGLAAPPPPSTGPPILI